MLRPGTTLDRYSIERMLGEGGMGAVYLALDMRLARQVAIKILRLSAGQGVKAAAARLLREARAVASFDHPNAVTIFDVGEFDDSPYIAMEFVSGTTLRALAGSDAAWQVKARWLAEVARALGAAHKIGLVHCDVKPDNVMVRDDGLVKVLDFGIARRTKPAPNSKTSLDDAADEKAPKAPAAGGGKRGRREIMGSPQYMAPEQLNGVAADPSTDQYAWGVTAFHVLAGRTPWGEQRNSMELFARILHGDPVSLKDEAPDVPPGLAAIVDRAMAKKAAERFPNMEEIVRGIEDLLGTHGAPLTMAHPLSARIVAANVDVSSPTERVVNEVAAEPRPQPQVALTAASPAAAQGGRRPWVLAWGALVFALGFAAGALAFAR